MAAFRSAVLALIDWLPEDVLADAELVTGVLGGSGDVPSVSMERGCVPGGIEASDDASRRVSA
jgi:hypothetical protein